MTFHSRFHLPSYGLLFTCLLIPAFFAGCAATPAKVTIGGETRLSAAEIEPAAANSSGQSELAFCVSGSTPKMLAYEIDQFRRHAPFRRLALTGSGAQCDVNLRIVWVYNTGSGMAVASLPDDGAELLRAEAEGVYGPVYGLERLGPLVYNAFLPGTPLYNKVIDARKAREAAWQETVRQYRAAPVKPVLPEEARKFQVQAEAAFAQKEFAEAAGHYLGALKIAPWWAAGYFNRSLLLGEIERYRDAIGEMRKYLDLAPDAPDARAAQDKIYEWERLAAKSAPAQTEMEILNQMRSEANSRTGKLKK